MGRKPNVGLGPSVKNPNVSKPPTGSVGGGGFVPLPFPGIGRPAVPPKEYMSSIGSIGGEGDGRYYMGGSRGFYKPDLTEEQLLNSEGIRKEDLVGGGNIGDGRIPFPIVIPPKDPDKGGDEPNPKTGGIRQDPRRNGGRTRPDGKQIDKSPEARQKFLDGLTREELEQRSHQDPVRGSRVQPVQGGNSRVKPVQEGSSRVKPVQDRRTRDFNPNLESFDAKQYLANYGDLQKAFGTDEAKARQHFIDYGIKEGRVDTAGGGTLKAENRDRRAKNFKAKTKALAAKRREGFLRGEEGATFDAKQYLANYADLQKAFGSDEEKARQHYRQYGAKEGRVDTKM